MRPLMLSFIAFTIHASTTAHDLEFADSFDAGMKHWKPTDASKWTITQVDGNNPALQLLGASDYAPPHRSPLSIALLQDIVVGDFTLTARVQTLQTTRGHRDMCLFFGYQDPANFYYVHLGERPDPNSSQIFIVDDAPRTKITTSPDVGVPWKDAEWHQVKVVRDTQTGTIEVYFDDMDSPQKTAVDTTFTWGAIGLGSFDDLGLWDDIRLIGHTAKGEVEWTFRAKEAKE